MKTRLLLNVFLLVNNLHLIYVDCKQVANVIKAMPSNKAPGIDTPFDYVNHQCFSFSFNRGGEPRNDVLTTCKAVTLRGGQRIIAVFFPE